MRKNKALIGQNTLMGNITYSVKVKAYEKRRIWQNFPKWFSGIFSTFLSRKLTKNMCLDITVNREHLQWLDNTYLGNILYQKKILTHGTRIDLIKNSLYLRYQKNFLTPVSEKIYLRFACQKINIDDGIIKFIPPIYPVHTHTPLSCEQR